LQFWRSSDEQVVRRAMPVLRDLLLESSHLFDALAREDGMDFGLVKQGICMLFTTERGRRSCEHEAELANQIGVDARMLDRAGLGSLDPVVDFRASGGVFFPGDSHLVPAALVRDLAASLSRSGVRIIENCSVMGFDVARDRIASVRTNGGTLQAEEFVLAGGAWSPTIVSDLGIRMLLQAGKGYSITVRKPAVNTSHPYIFVERRVAVTPFADSIRFAGTMEIAGNDLSINRPRVDAILDAIPVYFGNIARPVTAEHEIWAGLRPVTPDGMPYIGRFKQIRNLIAATGHAMVGISLAAVTGKLVAEIAFGRKPSHDLALLNPNRFD
jgi:D-amino-acid dehydrogenase